MGTLDVQERRLANLTVSRPLRRNVICLISAPRWSRPKTRKLWKYSCRSSPPLIDGVTSACIICGYETNSLKLQEHGIITRSTDFCQCKKCSRQAHSKCVDKQFLVRNTFCCENIERFLGNDAIELMPLTPIPTKPTREDMKCLICGDACSGGTNVRIDCNIDGCKYGVHEVCAAILAKINGKVLDATELKCSHVNYYLKPSEVSDLSRDYARRFDSMKIILRARGIIKPKSYTPKRTRYSNPDIECELCGEEVNINEEDHLLVHCSARCAGTPIPTRDYEYVMTRAKRLRRMTLKDHIP